MATNAAFLAAEESKPPRKIPITVQPLWQAGKSMKALTWQAKECVRLVDHEPPDLTDDADVLVQVTGATVCGSDLHLYHGEPFELKPGDILGHECCGIIDKVGPAVKKHKVGDRVVVSAVIACGSCDYCKKGLFSGCENTNPSRNMEEMYGHVFSGIFGYGHITGGYPGCQAELVRVPFGDTNATHIPDDVSNEKALYLSDIVVTSYHAVRDTGVQTGETIGVWGLGPIGLLICQWLKFFGVGRIIAIDRVPERLKLAHDKYGAETINFDEYENVPRRVLELVPKGLDRAIDAAAFRYEKSTSQKLKRTMGLQTDTSDIMNECIVSTKKFGNVGLIADYLGYADGFNVGAFMEKGIRLIGCSQNPGQAYVAECMEHVRQGRFNPLDIVTHRFRFEDIEEVYKRFDQKKGGIVKPFLETHFSAPRDPQSPPLQRDVWVDVQT